MRKVLGVDPNDADAHYFVGSLDMTLGDVNGAIGEFEAALKMQPRHASAEFGLARALQRSGRTDEAHEHLKVFQHYTQEKIAAPLSVGYGERGHYSTMEEMAVPLAAVGAMIPVKFKAQELPGAADGGAVISWLGPGVGACVIDIEGPGSQDLVTFGPGRNAIWAYRNLHNGSYRAHPVESNGT